METYNNTKIGFKSLAPHHCWHEYSQRLCIPSSRMLIERHSTMVMEDKKSCHITITVSMRMQIELNNIGSNMSLKIIMMLLKNVLVL